MSSREHRDAAQRSAGDNDEDSTICERCNDRLGDSVSWLSGRFLPRSARHRQ